MAIGEADRDRVSRHGGDSVSGQGVQGIRDGISMNEGSFWELGSGVEADLRRPGGAEDTKATVMGRSNELGGGGGGEGRFQAEEKRGTCEGWGRLPVSPLGLRTGGGIGVQNGREDAAGEQGRWDLESGGQSKNKDHWN